MTLPLIYSLNKSTWLEKRRIINIVKNHNNDPNKVKEVIQFVFDKGGIAYAETIMNDYKAKALAILATLPDSDSKKSLEQLVKYTTERKK